MTRLIAPDPDRYEEFVELVADSDETNDGIPHGSGLWEPGTGTTPEGFAAHVAVSALRADPSVVPPDGKVRCTQFWIADDEGALVGFLSLRHELNDFLREKGGHIGYSVRRSRRREGHAKAALGLAVAHARTLGVDRALVTCDEDNVASAATIESQGGVLEDVRNGKRRYWIS
ncbi:MAG: GNAT family N-acetyltransferase [Nocardioides sp.]|uniref:GNAT family N-acetyltransferase n=1 Tax=Nocardioides sp. TaxID=35761 RepID=UPI0039E6E41A